MMGGLQVLQVFQVLCNSGIMPIFARDQDFDHVLEYHNEVGRFVITALVKELA